ncbi:NADH-ubiquinone oxidoreductase chain 2, partial [Frankliniella fusca]
ILNCVKEGKENRIFSGWDGGKLHEQKRRKAQASRPADSPYVPPLPFGLNVWKTFPSSHIPDMFKGGGGGGVK